MIHLKKKFFCAGVLVASFLAPASGIAQTIGSIRASLSSAGVSAASAGASRLSAPSTDNIRIGVGDVLEVAVFDTPELSGKVRVNDAGMISLPLLGLVSVQGLSPAQAQDVLCRKLKEGEFLKDPQVQVGVAEFGVQGIMVTGEVKRPGTVPPSGSRRLLDVIASVDGMTPVASKTVLVFHRGNPDEPVKVKISDKPEEALAANLELQPGDTVLVPKAGVVYVIGDVGKPGGFVMDSDNVSIMQAMALAAGPNRTAKLSDARIIRKTEGGVQEIPVHLAKVFSAKSADIALQSGDIVFVPSSMLKSAAKASSQSILQSVLSMGLYSVVR